MGGGPKIPASWKKKKAEYSNILGTRNRKNTAATHDLVLVLCMLEQALLNGPLEGGCKHSEGQTQEVKSAVKEFHLRHKVKAKPVTNAGFSCYVLQVKLCPRVRH